MTDDPSRNPLVAILLTQDAQAEMSAARLEATDLDGLEAWPCESEKDRADLEEILGAVQTRLGKLEEVRETITKPMAQAKAAVDTLFRNARAPYEAAKATIKAKVEGYLARQLEVRREALALASEAAKAGDQETVATALEVAGDHGLQKSTTHGVTMEWAWELEDINLVPSEFLALNPASMKMYVSRFKNSDSIEPVRGIRFIRRPKVIARRG